MITNTNLIITIDTLAVIVLLVILLKMVRKNRDWGENP